MNRVIFYGVDGRVALVPQHDAALHNLMPIALSEAVDGAFKLFHLDAEEMVRIDLYVWLEGQDVDCINEIHKAQILANIQFSASGEGQSGLVPIE